MVAGEFLLRRVSQHTSLTLSGGVLCPGQMILFCQTGVRTPYTDGTLLRFQVITSFCVLETLFQIRTFPPEKMVDVDVCLPVRLSVCFFCYVCLSACLLFCLPAFMSNRLSVYFVCLSVFPFVCLSVCLAVCLSFCLFMIVYLSLCLSFRLSCCLSVCLCVFLSCQNSVPWKSKS